MPIFKRNATVYTTVYFMYEYITKNRLSKK
jgi:hypothetical protein